MRSSLQPACGDKTQRGEFVKRVLSLSPVSPLRKRRGAWVERKPSRLRSSRPPARRLDHRHNTRSDRFRQRRPTGHDHSQIGVINGCRCSVCAGFCAALFGNRCFLRGILRGFESGRAGGANVEFLRGSDDVQCRLWTTTKTRRSRLPLVLIRFDRSNAGLASVPPSFAFPWPWLNAR